MRDPFLLPILHLGKFLRGNKDAHTVESLHLPSSLIINSQDLMSLRAVWKHTGVDFMLRSLFREYEENKLCFLLQAEERNLLTQSAP